MPAMISSPVTRFVSRYNSLYITKFRYDTGGLQFPTAIDQLFTDLHSLEGLPGWTVLPGSRRE